MKEEFVPFPPKDGNIPFFISLTGISHSDASYRINRTKSKIMCMEYIIDGEGCVILDGKSYYPQKGDIYLLPPGKDHLYFSDQKNPWEKIWFNAEGALINNLLSVYNPTNTVVFKNCGGYEYFLKIHQIGRNNSLSATEKHEGSALIFHELLQFLYNKAQNHHISEESKILTEYINNNINKAISLKNLAELVYLSESQVIRIFKRDFGKTPYDYILDLKIERAKTLLANTGLMIKEISFNLGFCDEHYFSYIFKEKTSKTPSEYRKTS